MNNNGTVKDREYSCLIPFFDKYTKLKFGYFKIVVKCKYNEVRNTLYFLTGGFQLIKQVGSLNLPPRCSGVMSCYARLPILKEEVIITKSPDKPINILMERIWKKILNIKNILKDSLEMIYDTGIYLYMGIHSSYSSWE